MEQFLRQHTFIRLLIPFIAGIIAAGYIPQINTCYYIIFGVVIFILMLMFVKYFTRSKIFGILTNVLFFVTGLYITSVNKPTQPVNNQNATLVHASTVGYPKPKQKGYSVELKIHAIKQDKTWVQTEQNIMAFFCADSMSAQLKAGQQIVFNSGIKGQAGRMNPFGFDYNEYLFNNNITGTVYIKSGQWLIVNHETTGIKNIALNIRHKLIDILKKNHLTDQNLAVVSALVLGYKDELSAAVKDAYSAAGAVHVLAVSGLHVGIIFMVLNTLLGWLNKNKHTNAIKQVIILVCIWVYALITGLSPSVMRAAVMFSFVLLGNILNKKSHIYNSLAASALLLLLINPQLLYNIGFQLSYMAVVGIVFFVPYIVNWVYIKNKAGHYFWQLISVSLSAQLATTPLTFYYFKQFPTYFLLTNTFVVIAGTIILYAGLLIITVSPISIISGFLGRALNAFTLVLNNTINGISNLPKSVITNVSLSAFDSVFLYIIIISITTFFISKNAKALIICMLSIIVLQTWPLLYNFKNYNRQVFCVYSTQQNTIMHFVNGFNSILLTSDTTNNKYTKNFYRDALDYWHIKPTNNTTVLLNDTIMLNNFWYNKNRWVNNNQKGLILANNTKNLQLKNNNIFIDYVLVTEYTALKPSNILNNLNIDKIIVGGTVPQYLITNNKLNLPSNIATHYVSTQGAYINIKHKPDN